MSFTRISEDKVRVSKYLQETTDQGKYMLNTPGQGMDPYYMEDPHFRLEGWGGNLAENAIDLESDLRCLTRNLNRDEITKNTHLNHDVEKQNRQMSTMNNTTTDQSRVTNPTWWHREERQHRPQHLLYNPQNHVIPDFTQNVSSRKEQKQEHN